MRESSVCFACCLAWNTFAQTITLYQNNFETNEVGKVPAEFLVLDGGFAVRQENGNKFLELPGAPLDSFGAQFGPAEAENVALSARIKGTGKGRRYPTFGIGLNGASGYKLQVSPGKKALEIYQDQEVKATAWFEWKPDQWTKLRMQVRKTGEMEWKIEGKAWVEGGPEPEHWMISVQTKDAPGSGKASIFGSPFAGTPIQFDDLMIEKVSNSRR